MVSPTLLAAATADPHPAMILPFALMLLAIALMPFIHLHWWERHFPKVAMGLGAVTTIYYVFVLGNAGRMLHVGHEYLSFIALIGSLFVATHDHELIAISLGAVFFGAMTHIGNGPNLMVKSIAEQTKVKTPSFFAYLLKYALPILIPLMVLISLLFFSRWRLF